jgi:hypothetical protein
MTWLFEWSSIICYDSGNLNQKDPFKLTVDFTWNHPQFFFYESMHCIVLSTHQADITSKHIVYTSLVIMTCLAYAYLSDALMMLLLFFFQFHLRILKCYHQLYIFKIVCYY